MRYFPDENEEAYPLLFLFRVDKELDDASAAAQAVRLGLSTLPGNAALQRLRPLP